MSNDAFTRSVKARLLLPDGEQWPNCQCNMEVGPLFSHCYRCSVVAVRNPIRNALHKDLKARFSDIVKARELVAEIVDYLQVTQWYCHPKQLFLYVSLMKLTTLAIVSYVEPENITISLS